MEGGRKEKRRKKTVRNSRTRTFLFIELCVCLRNSAIVGLSEQVLAFSILHSSVTGESSKLSSLCTVDDEIGGVAQGIQVPSDGRGAR